jgi:cell division protein FtsB
VLTRPPADPENLTTLRRLAPRFVALQADRDAVARERDALRAEVAKLREKVQWLESEIDAGRIRQ